MSVRGARRGNLSMPESRAALQIRLSYEVAALRSQGHGGINIYHL